MNDRVLALIIAVLTVPLAAHFGPLILAVATVAIIGTTAVLAWRVASIIQQTGRRYVPARKARTA
jgi:O-antigen/teichoic acid export membrane protein